MQARYSPITIDVGPEAAEKMVIGNWVFFGTGNKDQPRGNGTGILTHKDIIVESWHHASPRSTAVRIPYGKRHLMIISAYAPVQPGSNDTSRTIHFYEQLAAKVNESKGKGVIVIVWGTCMLGSGKAVPRSSLANGRVTKKARAQEA